MKSIEIRHQKASIHKSRLFKFGKSKMNNKTYYLDEEGKVFTISEKAKSPDVPLNLML